MAAQTNSETQEAEQGNRMGAKTPVQFSLLGMVHGEGYLRSSASK